MTTANTSVLELLERLAPLIDERTGTLAGLARLTFPPHFRGQMFGYSTCVPRTTVLHRLPVAASPRLGSLMGYGTAIDEPTAKIRAVCEGIERYCAVMYPTHGVRRATFASLAPGALDPQRLPQCSDRERAQAPPAFRLQRSDPERLDYWIEGYSVTHDRPIWVPLSAAYLGLPLSISEHVVFPMSTGFAVGASYEQAVLSGLLEVIERDSLALWWLHRLPMPRLIGAESGEPRLAELLARNREAGVESKLFDLTTDVGVPVVGIVQSSDAYTPHVVAMAACRGDAPSAALRVLEEAGSLRIALSAPRPPVTRAQFSGAAQMAPEDFGLLYASPGALSHFDFATSAPVKSSLPPPVEGNAVHEIVRRLARLGMEVIAVDVTLPEIAEFGLRVVRVIVPELMALTFSHHVRYLAHPRLYSAPRALGYGPRTEESITDDPIPFA